MKNRLLDFIKINCYAFTIVFIVNECNYLLQQSQRGRFDGIAMFIATTLIAALIVWVEGITFKKKIITSLLHIAIVLACSTGILCLFNADKMTVYWIVSNIIFTLGVYAGVSGLLFWESFIDSKIINQKIKKMRESDKK